MFAPALNLTSHLLFVQQGNNWNDLVPIAICCWRLVWTQYGTAFSCHGRGSASLSGFSTVCCHWVGFMNMH